jgi:hypothetical protein
MQAVDTISVRQHRDIFRFNRTKKYPWLQKIAFWILAKLDCYHTEQSIQHKRIEINNYTFGPALLRQYEEFGRFVSERPSKIYMGPDQLDELIGSTDFHNILRFTVPMIYGSRGHAEVLGMEVVVVPWLNGFFIPPDALRPRQ